MPPSSEPSRSGSHLPFGGDGQDYPTSRSERDDRDPLLHEVATALRDITAALALYEQARSLGWDDADERLRLLMVGAAYCEPVLEKVVQREGDIIPTPPGGPERWR